MNRVRTFVAIELSAETRKSLRREAERLAASGAEVKWVREENLHITLKFLGQVDRRAVSEIMKALESAAGGAEPFRAEVAGVSFFPKPTRPRIVAAGVDPHAAERLTELAEGLRRFARQEEEKEAPEEEESETEEPKGPPGPPPAGY